MCIIEGLMARKEPKSPKVRGSGDLLEHQHLRGLCGDDGPKALKSRSGKGSPVGQQPDSWHRTKRSLSGVLQSATRTPSLLTPWVYTLVTTRATSFPATPFIGSSTQF